MHRRMTDLTCCVSLYDLSVITLCHNDKFPVCASRDSRDERREREKYMQGHDEQPRDHCRFVIRAATHDDVPVLTRLIELSVRNLSLGYYDSQQIDASLVDVFGVDSALIEDATYFVVELAMAVPPEEEEEGGVGGVVVACGGWSRRQTMCGSDKHKKHSNSNDAYLDPLTAPARIRAFFVHPDFARKGLATLLLSHCEEEAKKHGFTRLLLVAALPGVPFYTRHGYVKTGEQLLPMAQGSLTLPCLIMEKQWNITNDDR